MNEKTTGRLDTILKSAKLKDFDKYVNQELREELPTLSDYLKEYITQKGLNTSAVIRDSLLSANYAYAILNGHKANPDRDRIIALCLSMHMTLVEVQRALKLCNAGVLYAKNKRDAIIIICFNSGVYNIMQLNTFLADNGLKILQTSRDAAYSDNASEKQ